MSEYLDKIHKADDTFTAVAREMVYLANAFRVTGNSTMSARLFHMADELREAAEQVNKAVAKELNESVRQAHENSANLVRSALAGMKLGKNEDGVGDVSDTD